MEKTSTYNTQNTPLLLKVLCYYIVIKTGIKITLALVFLISGGRIESLNKVIGFDTINNGGIALELFIVTTGALHIYAAFQMVQLKKIGLYIHIPLVLLMFFAPAFFAPETYKYNASRIGFMLPMLVLPGIYFSKMK